MSNVDPTVPVQGNPTTQSVRDNFSTIKTELEAFQSTSTTSDGAALVGHKRKLSTGTFATGAEAQDLSEVLARRQFWATEFLTDALVAEVAGGSPTSDMQAGIQAAIDAAEAQGGGDVMLPALGAATTYPIGTQLTIDSSKHVRLIGVGGVVQLKWIGATHNTSTQDDSTGAMLYFTGTDHAWSGVRGVHFDAQAKANHCIYVSGTINTGFLLEDLRFKWPQLDGLFVQHNGTTGPNGMVLRKITSFPQTTINNITCACGRSVLHFHLNNSAGLVHVLDGVFDNGGTNGVIYWETETNARTDLMVTNAKAENWNSTGDATTSDADFIVTKHDVDTSVGTIIINGVKLSQSGDTAWNALIHNKSAVARRMISYVKPLLLNNAITKIYEEDNDSSFDEVYDAKYLGADFVLNTSASCTVLPTGNAMPTTPIQGTAYWDATNQVLKIYGTSEHTLSPLGKSPVRAKTSSPYAVLATESGYTFTNNGASGTIEFDLPPIATVGNGFEVRFVATFAQIITVDPDAADKINGATDGAAISSSGAAHEALKLVSSSGDGWTIVEREGTWA